MRRFVFQMRSTQLCALLAAGASVVFAPGLSCQAAVFKLADPPTDANKLTFTLSDSTSYTASGEFKVNTAPSSDYNITAWNISVVKTSDSSEQRFVYNTQGFGDNSIASSLVVGNSNSFTLCSPDCTPTNAQLTLNFAQNFNSIFVDGTSSSSSSKLASTDLISSVSFRNSGGTLLDSTSATGQADFVPFSPAPLAFLPVFPALMLIKNRKLGNTGSV